jgi:F-type H+-transporting ATPase subunit b
MLRLTTGEGIATGAVSHGAADAPHLLRVQETQTSAAPATTATTEQHEKSAGMPQLEFGDYPPQLVWLLITFGLLLILMSRVALPRVAGVLKARETRIQEDLDRAERLKTDADATLGEYHKTIAQARAKAQGELRQSQAAIAAEAAKRDADFAARLNERTQAAEGNIAAAKTRALADLRGLSAEVTGSVLGKVAGVSLAPAQVQAAVDAAMTER